LFSSLIMIVYSSFAERRGPSSVRPKLRKTVRGAKPAHGSIAISVAEFAGGAALWASLGGGVRPSLRRCGHARNRAFADRRCRQRDDVPVDADLERSVAALVGWHTFVPGKYGE
jgi:hypothetical protein